MGLVNIGPETEQIEYKKTIGEIKEAMISIAAILNKHQQGELYFGVKNDGTVVGQEIKDRFVEIRSLHVHFIIHKIWKVSQLG